MLEGKGNATIRSLSDNGSKGVLPLNDEVLNKLRSLHPDAVSPTPAALFQEPKQDIHNIVKQL